jgi:hypothetical protein
MTPGGYDSPMCTRYISRDDAAIERFWHVGARDIWRMREVFPRQPGTFIRTARDSTERELVFGTWG